MLVKCPVRVHLIDHKHIPILGIIRKEYIDMVPVYTFLPPYIAVVVVHLSLPLLARSIPATAHTSFGILDAYIMAIHLSVFHLVVAGSFLCLGRLDIRQRGRHRCAVAFGLCHLLRGLDLMFHVSPVIIYSFNSFRRYITHRLIMPDGI